MAKREEITRGQVEKAVEIFLQAAYGGGGSRHPFPLADEAGTGGNIFKLFRNETWDEGQVRSIPKMELGRTFQRFSLGLGNRDYPFMKLVLQEHLVPGEFYFVVDTHDQMEIPPDFPDYEAWMRVKKSNRELKQEIETRFEEVGLPTQASIRLKAQAMKPGKETARRPFLVLLVDDEDQEARTLEHLLRLQGFEVSLASNGKEALDRLASVDPSILVLDYEMPEMDGLALIRELRTREATRKLPILLTTAHKGLGVQEATVDGFLAKPYDSRDLVGLIDLLLARR